MHAELRAMLVGMILAGVLSAQPMPDMPGMSMNPAAPANAAEMYLMDMLSGTSMGPQSDPMSMLMRPAGSWNLMFGAQAFIVETQQAHPHGGDKLWSPNNFMFDAIHPLGSGSVLFQTMWSLEPATITGERYPLLFQTGETAYGKPLVDGQHPHDLFMALGVQYAHPIGEETMFQLYYAPVGDPALGPVAFPHRSSASEIPEAPLGHHWQDSTHIADNVATVALKHSWLRLEASGFYGSEPDENRWNIDWGPMNSYSGRVSIFPGANWMAQFSAGYLTRPERQTPGDVIRTTGSIHYSRPLAERRDWSTSLIWGRNHDKFTGRNLNSYLAETVYPVTARNFMTARAELVDKDELFAATPALEQQIDSASGSTFRIGAYTVGYTRDLGTFAHIETGVGANATAYALPSAIKPYYGDRPWGVNVYLRFRLVKQPTS